MMQVAYGHLLATLCMMPQAEWYWLVYLWVYLIYLYMAKAMYDEQQCILVAFENGVLMSDDELKLFHPVQMQHVKELMEIADGVTNNLEAHILGLETWQYNDESDRVGAVGDM
ncbi:hypothetical protein EDC04DRAFT_2611328 [Pisolithus marmoratus]|nr:hypothetical protein EDC04DRAFT_2611328 [Pisolithus marmoratus]